MENIITQILLALLGVLLPSFLIYALLLFINNIIWGFKGIDTNKKTENYKKRKRKLFGVSILISIVGLIVWGALNEKQASSVYSDSTTQEEKITAISFDDCEFIVNFPTETKQKNVFQSGVELVRVESVYKKSNPYLRAECIPMANENIEKVVSSLPETMSNYAQQFGIKNPEITIEKTQLGTVGKFSGLRKAGDHEAMCVGKVYAGKHSMLMLFTTELASKYPSEKLLIFLNSVTTKTPQ